MAAGRTTGNRPGLRASRQHGDRDDSTDARRNRALLTSGTDDQRVRRNPAAGRVASLPLGFLLLVTVLFAARPISSDELWWDMSRGRAVAAGSLMPSRQLLSLETNADADWLSGLPVWLIYEVSGAFGLMVARLVCMLLVAIFLYRQASALPIAWRLLLPVLALGVSTALFDPGPLLFDALGLVLLYAFFNCTQFSASSSSAAAASSSAAAAAATAAAIAASAGRPDSNRTMAGHDHCVPCEVPVAEGRSSGASGDSGNVSWWDLLLIAALFVAWANLGQRVLIGWLGLISLLSIRSHVNKVSPPSAAVTVENVRLAWCLRWSALRYAMNGRYLLVAVLASCVTPRGWYTPWDALRLLFPPLAAESWVLTPTSWSALANVNWGPVEWGWIWLSVVVGLLLLSGPRERWPMLLGVWVPTQAIGWTAVENLPLAAIGLALVAASCLAGANSHKQTLKMNQTVEPAWSRIRAGFLAGPFNRSRLTRPIRPLLCIAGWLLVGGGLLPVAYERFGWGIEARLDDRYLRLALSLAQPHGTAFATEARGAGLLCWVNSTDIQVQDLPRRALLGGRLRTHRLLCDDLRQQRQHVYWRADDTQGGWWLPLTQRQTSLVLVAAEEVSLIRALEPSIYKPLSLDAPVIPYAAAGDSAYARLLLEVLKQREFVELGSWQYQPAPGMLSSFERLPGTPAARLTEVHGLHRQASVFRAMQLHRAALKVLSYALAKHAPLPHSFATAARPASSQSAAENVSFDSGRTDISDLHALTSRSSTNKHNQTTPLPRLVLSGWLGTDSAQRQALRAIRREFTACQVELAYQEQLRAGQASWFRLAAMRLNHEGDREHGINDNMRAALSIPAQAEINNLPADLSQALWWYGQGQLDQAQASLRREHPESFYAAACLAVEQGAPEVALNWLRSWPDSAAEAYLSILAKTLLIELKSPLESSDE